MYQVKLLNEKLSRVPDLDKLNIKVSTVDGFQGDECDIIILSCVRSHSCRVRDDSRLHDGSRERHRVRDDNLRRYPFSQREFERLQRKRDERNDKRKLIPCKHFFMGIVRLE